MTLLVLLVLWVPDDLDDHRVEVHLHFLHPDPMGLVSCGLVKVHDLLVRSTRPLLHVLTRLGRVQRELERVTALDRRRVGVPRALCRVVSPLLLLDATLLYLGAAGAEEAPGSCGSCGGGMALTCTPPRLDRAGRLRRDALDRAVPFCWTCLSRDFHAAELAELAAATASAAAADLPALGRTHQAPQNWE